IEREEIIGREREQSLADDPHLEEIDVPLRIAPHQIGADAHRERQHGLEYEGVHLGRQRHVEPMKQRPVKEQNAGVSQTIGKRGASRNSPPSASAIRCIASRAREKCSALGAGSQSRSSSSSPHSPSRTASRPVGRSRPIANSTSVRPTSSSSGNRSEATSSA